ncbi:nuclear transport factor 2 family protein [Bradyrhizobium sp. CCBAU 11357]|uniref:nuclear transport factor 2 family protein n=1 Tax=Bradyrhizobium sp. CCBAU 11357 TaxID=1630808 RepID=UPI0023045C57|nr:nuclear transport factor 2 family protein [Bradyrhizobium sp. CCBAU 11357]
MAQREEMLALIKTAYDARGKGDIEGLVTAFHPEGHFTLMGDKGALELTGRMEGHPTLRAAFAQFADTFGFESREILAELVDGDRVAGPFPGRRSLQSRRKDFQHRDPGPVQISGWQDRRVDRVCGHGADQGGDCVTGDDGLKRPRATPDDECQSAPVLHRLPSTSRGSALDGGSGD